MDKQERVKELLDEIKSLNCEVETRAVTESNIALNKTKGIIAEEKKISDSCSSVIIESAESGRGFSLYTDYNKFDDTEKQRFKRLSR
jgi:L-lactate utilization protein LutC